MGKGEWESETGTSTVPGGRIDPLYNVLKKRNNRGSYAEQTKQKERENITKLKLALTKPSTQSVLALSLAGHRHLET